jgi:hypothetical protein
MEQQVPAAEKWLILGLDMGSMEGAAGKSLLSQ